eukprot:Sspe_Gene.93091::Locus_65798_Transcript_1_3_Confidence_0.500_Length_1392::g.93091::m.93091
MVERIAAFCLGALGGGCAVHGWWVRWRTSTPPVAPPSSTDPTPSRPEAKYGLPGDEHVYYNEGYISSDNYRLRVPNWVLEHLTPDMLKGAEAGREKSSFKHVDCISTKHRATLSDYREARADGEPLVRGHMVPAADMKHSQNAMDATFLLNHNVVPQDEVNNEGAWFYLEALVRRSARKHANTWVVTGPAWLPTPLHGNTKEVRYKTVGQHSVAVPTHLFKVVLTELDGGAKALGTFLVPNTSSHDAPAAFQHSIDDLESVTGLHFFPWLNRAGLKDFCGIEKCTEKPKVPSSWGKRRQSDPAPSADERVEEA